MEKTRKLALVGFILIALSLVVLGLNLPEWVANGLFTVVNGIWLLIADKEENNYLLVGSLILLFLGSFPLDFNLTTPVTFVMAIIMFIALTLFGIGLYYMNNWFAQAAGIIYIFAGALLFSLPELAGLLLLAGLFFEGLALLEYSKVRKIKIPIKFYS